MSDHTRDRLNRSPHFRLNPDGWGPLYITDATFGRMNKVMEVFRFDTVDGFLSNDHFLTYAMLKLLEYRERELTDEEAAKRVRRPIPDGMRKMVLERDGHTCTRCGATTDLHLHHVTPVSEGGQNEPENLKTVCAECHRVIHMERGDKYAMKPPGYYESTNVTP